MMLAVGLSYIAFYYVEVCSLYAHFLENFFFIINEVEVYQKLFLHLLTLSYGFYSLIC